MQQEEAHKRGTLPEKHFREAGRDLQLSCHMS